MATSESKTDYAIKVDRVDKSFQSLQALSDVSFTVPKNTIFTILGPNGAGKTTLLKILTTVTRPDSGAINILGCDIRKKPVEIRNSIGVVSQESRFERYFTIWENLTLHAELHGVSKSVYEPRIKELLDQVGLYDRRNSLSDELSGGMQRRVCLIRALVHRPQILFLDEPTSGLDPFSRRQIWDVIQGLKQDTTVVLTTHYMEEADLLSDQIMMLNHGQVVMCGTARELKQKITPQNRYEVILKVPKAHEYKNKMGVLLPELTAPTDLLVVDDYKLELILNHPDELFQVLKVLDPRELQRIGVLEADLEAVFMRVVQTPKEVSS